MPRTWISCPSLNLDRKSSPNLFSYQEFFLYFFFFLLPARKTPVWIDISFLGLHLDTQTSYISAAVMAANPDVLAANEPNKVFDTVLVLDFG